MIAAQVKWRKLDGLKRLPEITQLSAEHAGASLQCPWNGGFGECSEADSCPGDCRLRAGDGCVHHCPPQGALVEVTLRFGVINCSAGAWPP